ncbi:MAG TPA: phosphatidate cytidylyltransferase [Blastocatellia bacterium]|nr:phosphatidate cytidylyltransferase [Blastocatellia bacterium]
MWTAIENLAPLWRMGLLVLAALVVASAIVILLRLLKPQKNFAELSARVWAWWIMAAVFFGAVAISDVVSIVFFGFMSFWAMKEYITLLKTRPADHGSLVLTFLAIPVQYYWISIAWYGMFSIFIPVYMSLFLPVRLVLAKETKGYVASAAQIQWGLMAFVFGLSHVGFLLTLPAVSGTSADGRTMLLFLVFVVEISDVLQYVWGKTLGRHKIIPAISPNKTWEGFIGGIASAMLLSLTIRFLTPFSAAETLFVSLLITVAGFCGGAVMSAVKRDFGVKDFGGIIPGHGGMLDRVDSLCYAAPIFLHYVRYFHY